MKFMCGPLLRIIYTHCAILIKTMLHAIFVATLIKFYQHHAGTLTESVRNVYVLSSIMSKNAQFATDLCLIQIYLKLLSESATNFYIFYFLKAYKWHTNNIFLSGYNKIIIYQQIYSCALIGSISETLMVIHR